jgi:hypothetical protein
LPDLSLRRATTISSWWGNMHLLSESFSSVNHSLDREWWLFRCIVPAKRTVPPYRPGGMDMYVF